MLDRRAAIAAAFVLVCGASLEGASETTPASAMAQLKTGNARFVQQAATPSAADSSVPQAKASGEPPVAMVLSCADSLVPPEAIFGVGPGEIFVVRTVGEVTDKAVLATIEHGAQHLQVPLLVVMGHEACSTVATALAAPQGSVSRGPSLDALIAAIRPAFDRMAEPADMAHLREAILANVEQVVNEILAKSAIVKELVVAGKLQLVGAYYEAGTGRVRFSQPVGAAAAAAPVSAESPR